LPSTYDELLVAAEKLKAAGIPAFTFGGSVNCRAIVAGMMR